MIPIAEVSSFADGEQIDVPGLPRAVHAPGRAAILSDTATLGPRARPRR